jgi:hypothetical protein
MVARQSGVLKSTAYESLESPSRFADSRPSRCLRVAVVLHCLKPLTARLTENKVLLLKGDCDDNTFFVNRQEFAACLAAAR